MKRLFFLIAIGAMALVRPVDSWAFYPVDGWWWDPAQSGRGFNIEMQDDVMFISAFHFRPDGSPVWWIAAGHYDDSTGEMTGHFDEYAGGQCPGCPHTDSERTEGAGSPVRIEFTSPVTAVLHWDGETIPLSRMYWAYDLNNLSSFLFGEFHFTSGALGIYFGDRIYFNDTYTAADGSRYVSGRVREGSSGRIALARYDAETGLFAILLDSSTSYYKFFAFDMTKDRLEGLAWTFLKTDQPDGSGLPFIGHRVASRAYVQTGVGPHDSATPQTSEAFAFERDTQDAKLARVQAVKSGQGAMDLQTQRQLDQLRAALIVLGGSALQ